MDSSQFVGSCLLHRFAGTRRQVSRAFKLPEDRLEALRAFGVVQGNSMLSHPAIREDENGHGASEVNQREGARKNVKIPDRDVLES
jgi:hypothetical protein